MASFYSSNYYYQDHDDNYQYYNQSYNSYDYGSYQSYEPSYVQSYDHTGFYNNAYQLAPAEPIVGYVYCNYNNQPEFPASTKNGNFCGENGLYYDPVTTQFVVSYSNHGPAVSDLDFEEYNPEPYRGGYDIDLAYGKALSPSDDICYPTSKIGSIGSSLGDSSVLKPVPVPNGKEEKFLEGEGMGNSTGIVAANVIQEESAVDSDEDEDQDEEDEEEEEEDRLEDSEKQGNMQSIDGDINAANMNVSQAIQDENASKPEKLDEEDEEEDEEEEYEENVGGVGDDQTRNGGNGKEIRRQIPPGYGIEAIDICEGLFGGYFPCLLKRNQGSYDQRGGNEHRDDYECWQGTVDYLFGNPNPYGGGILERGRYGDPMYAYQRHYPQQSISGQVQFGEESSYLHSSRYYYGQ